MTLQKILIKTTKFADETQSQLKSEKCRGSYLTHIERVSLPMVKTFELLVTFKVVYTTS